MKQAPVQSTPFSSPFLRSAFALMVAAAAASLVTGCGISTGSAAKSIEVSPMAGMVHGGPNPISGATVRLYETNTAAAGATYGSAAKLLSTATTNAQGAFSFPNVTQPYTCDAGQFAYVTVSGGNTGAGATNANPNYILMTALGSCSNLSNIAAQSLTQIFVSEATTVASAYALSNFLTVTGTTVNVNAPATNNAVTGTCTANGCLSSGLSRAFGNAVALSSGVTFGGVNGLPTGLFNNSLTGYPGTVVPVAMLNIVADALQACVNSAGGTAGDGSACGTLFTDTTPNSLSNVPGNTNTVAPVETLTAAVNLAKTPYLLAANGPSVQVGNNAANPNTTGLFSLVTPTSFFQPTLAAAPTDYSLGVFYPGGATDIGYPYSLALDANGTIYVLGADGAAAAVSNSNGVQTVTTPSNATKSGLAAITYGTNGPALLYSNAATSSTAYPAPGTLAVDLNGNVYASNVSTTQTVIREFTGANGAPNATTPTITPNIAGTPVANGRALAVDRSNNLWMTSAVLGGQIFQVPNSGAVTLYSAAAPTAQAPVYGVIVDAAQNVWACTVGTSNGSNRTVALVPATAAAGQALLLSNPTVVTGSPAAKKAGFPGANLTSDAAGNVYCPTNVGLNQSNPINASGVIPFTAAVGYATGLGSPSSSVIDGNNVFAAGGNQAAGRLFILPISGTSTSAAIPFTNPVATQLPVPVDPCYALPAAAGGIYCSTNATAFPTGGTQLPFSLLAYNTSMVVDSAGSSWNAVGNYVTTNALPGIVQVIGTLAPTVPLISAARFGVKP